MRQAAAPATETIATSTAEVTHTPALTDTFTATGTPSWTATPSPTATNTATVEPTPPPNRPDALGVSYGSPLVGGNAYRAGRFTFIVPAGYSFNVSASLNDPGGFMLLVIFDDAMTSALRLWPETGEEEGRLVADPALSPVFDAIVASVILDPQ